MARGPLRLAKRSPAVITDRLRGGSFRQRLPRNDRKSSAQVLGAMFAACYASTHVQGRGLML
jgi:hypothetical protein